jgi:uncharacterized membrane protein SirB2
MNYKKRMDNDMKEVSSSRFRRNGLNFVVWGLFLLTFMIGIVAILLFTLNQGTAVSANWGSPAGVRNSAIDWINTITQALAIASLASFLGALILLRQPKHRIGWLLILFGIVASLNSFFIEYTVYSSFTISPPAAGHLISSWIANWIWVVLLAILFLTLALFHDGKFINKRWRLVFILIWLFFTLPTFTAAAIETPMTSAFSMPNPLVTQQRDQLYDFLLYTGVTFMVLSTVVVFSGIVVRYKTADSIVQQQIKWLVASLFTMILFILAGLYLFLGLGVNVGGVLVNLSVMLPLVAIGVAILKYRLFDIDVIIRKTLIYAVLTVSLALVYFGGVVLLQNVFEGISGQQSPLAIVISTLLIAALFNPLRGRIQDAIDRRFYRSKYNAQNALEEFAATARSETNLDALNAQIMGIVEKTMQPERVSLWMQPVANHWINKSPSDTG